MATTRSVGTRFAMSDAPTVQHARPRSIKDRRKTMRMLREIYSERCWHCDKPARVSHLIMCAGCKTALYCSGACMAADKKGIHGLVCARMAV